MKMFVRKATPFRAIQFKLADWDEICKLVGVPENGHGVWVDERGMLTKPGGGEPALYLKPEALGCLFFHKIVREGDWIAWEPDHEGFISVIKQVDMEHDYVEVSE